MPCACIGLGSNLGDRAQYLREAVERLAGHPDVRVLRESSFHETYPLGPPQPRFLNAAVVIETELGPRELLEVLRRIEDALGRERLVRWGPRVLDLDLLLYDEEAIETPELTVPHPEMQRRRFVLAPLAEICPEARHPLLRRSVRELLADLPPETAPSRRWYIAVCGPIGAGKTTLARRLAARLDALLLCEAASGSPLLGLFYRDMTRYALTTQIWFLLERTRQLGHADTATAPITVSDYLFDKHRLFADLVLPGGDREVYDVVARVAAPGLAAPDLVIYLSARPEVLMQRVTRRGRAAERRLTFDYLARLHASYETFLAGETPWPVLRLAAEATDSAGDDRVLDDLLMRIAAACSSEDAAPDPPAQVE